MASTFGNWSMPYWNGLASAERSAEQLYRDWIRGQQLTSENSPLSQVQKLTSSDLSGLSNNPYYLSSQEGSNASYGDSPTSPNAGPAPGAVAGALGALSNMAGQMAGMPAPAGAIMGGAVSGATSGRGALNGAVNSAIGLGLNALGPIGTLTGITMGLFGINPVDSILNSFDLPGLQDLGTPLGQMQSKSAMNALDQETSAIAQAAMDQSIHDQAISDAVASAMTGGDLGSDIDGLGGTVGFGGGFAGPADSLGALGDIGGIADGFGGFGSIGDVSDGSSSDGAGPGNGATGGADASDGPNGGWRRGGLIRCRYAHR